MFKERSTEEIIKLVNETCDELERLKNNKSNLKSNFKKTSIVQNNNKIVAKIKKEEKVNA